MALNHAKLVAMEARNRAVAWSDRDAMLYALAVGFSGDDPRSGERAFVIEQGGLKTVPTFATTLAEPDFPADCGWDYTQVLHTAQSLEVYVPPGAADEVLLDSFVVDAYDRDERGAVIVTRSEARRRRDQRAVFASTSTWLARGDTVGKREASYLPERHVLPVRTPDFVDELRITSEQVFLYRLCGDRNPLHVDKAAAQKAGFAQPIVHGLLTYGVACRSVLRTVCNYDTLSITGFDLSFTAPVYFDDELRIEMWQDGSIVSFRCIAAGRDSVVCDHGRCRLPDY